jgi:hypothetical protein
VAEDDPALPDTWSETENVVWKVAVPGLSWSSPIVWGDHVIVTSAIGEDGATPPRGFFNPAPSSAVTPDIVHRWVVVDVDLATGRIRWQTELHRGRPPISKQLKNSYASETPVTDGERVYVYWGSIGLLAALDMNGRLVWRAELGTFRTNQGWGTAASPLLYKGVLYVVNDNAERSFLAAFDARTGRELWQTGRDDVETYSTPVIWENELRTEIVTQGRFKFRSYGLDGALLWELPAIGRSPIATPVAGHGLLFLSSGYPGNQSRPVYAVRPGGAGDLSLGGRRHAREATATTPGRGGLIPAAARHETGPSCAGSRPPLPPLAAQLARRVGPVVVSERESVREQTPGDHAPGPLCVRSAPGVALNASDTLSAGRRPSAPAGWRGRPWERYAGL